MALWKDDKRKVGEDHPVFLSIHFDSSQVDGSVHPVIAVPQRHYFQIHLAHLFFRNADQGKKTAPSLRCVDSSSESAEQFDIDITIIVSPEIGPPDKKFALTYATPYRGMPVSLSLRVVTSQDDGENSVSDGFGFSRVFAEGELQAGYIGVVRTSKDEAALSRLRVVNNRLRIGQDSSDERSEPFETHDYLLFRVDVFEDRGDWDSLTEIQKPFQTALELLLDQFPEPEAYRHLREAMIRVHNSVELTAADKRRLVNALKVAFEATRARAGRKGGAAPIPSLHRVMQDSISVDEALVAGEPTLDEIHELTEFKRGRNTRGGIDFGAEPTSGADPDESEPENVSSQTPEQTKEFSFKLEGNDVIGDQVKFGADVDLIFNYGLIQENALSRLQGTDLQAIAKQGGDLGIAIIPKGLTVRDSNWYQKASFHDDAIAAPVRFKLRASKTEVEDAGVHVIFDAAGRSLYECFLPLTLTQTPVTTPGGAGFPAIQLDLDEIKQTAVALPRTASLTLTAQADAITAYFVDLRTVGEEPPLIASLRQITRASLANLLASIEAQISAVAGHPIWSVDGNPLDPPTAPNKQKAYRECMESVIEAGSTLYSALENDADFKPILARINQLPVGSRISIVTDCAFLPWEVFYPLPYSRAWNDALKQKFPIQVQEVWGEKYLFECQPLEKDYKPPVKARKSGAPFVSYNLNPTIDGSFLNGQFQPVKAQQQWAAEFSSRNHRIDLRTTGAAIQEMLFESSYEADLIYLYCHGRSEQIFQPGQTEMLELDQGVSFAPKDFPPDQAFPRAPVIFLNSCSSGAISPLSFSTFLTKFRQRKAMGLIASSFTIPALFAAAFGNAMIHAYLQDSEKTIGETLLELRRKLLTQQNPLGLFYSLQCPMDLTAPKSK